MPIYFAKVSICRRPLKLKYVNTREFDHVKIYKTYKKMVGQVIAAVFAVIAFAILSHKKRD
jgi:hypothetical protein